MAIQSTPKGVLIDLDGVMYVEDALIPGAVDAIYFLMERQIPCRFLTNTTVQSKKSLLTKLQRLGIPAEIGHIISPPGLAADYLREKGNPACFLVLQDSTKEDFVEIPQTEMNPQYVVLGKIGHRWTYDLLNKIFRLVMNGTEMIALHKDRTTQEKDGLSIEFGAFIAGLEYSTGKEALVIGKPSASFYQAALDSIGLPAQDVIMIGDDLISDIRGAQINGLKGVLVLTGKTQQQHLEQSTVKPDCILSSIAEIKQLFGM